MILDNKRFNRIRCLSKGRYDYERTRIERYRPDFISGVFLFNSFMSGFTGVMSFLNVPIYYDKQAYMEIKIYAKTRKGSHMVDVDNISSFVSGAVYVFDSITMDGNHRNLEWLCRKIHEAGSVVLIDNTFATFLHIKPWEYEADYTLESFTKYVTGHLDYMSGCLVLRNVDSLKFDEWCVNCGLYASVETEHMVYIGLQTMKLRLQKIEENTALACKLLDEKHVRYYYPGVGGVIWLIIKNPEQVVEGFKVIQPSDTFGLNYTTWTIYEDNAIFLRLSIGIENDMDKVLEDLKWLK
ncbi:PLP-dependent transferase [Allisonella histaminiformans]|uniref:PLP-dependent transferase n=1 Tax=Allisonella histaminiformans TaxID=209880 RepID=UPI0035204CE2